MRPVICGYLRFVISALFLRTVTEMRVNPNGKALCSWIGLKTEKSRNGKRQALSFPFAVVWYSKHTLKKCLFQFLVLWRRSLFYLAEIGIISNRALEQLPTRILSNGRILIPVQECSGGGSKEIVVLRIFFEMSYLTLGELFKGPILRFF